MKIGDRIKFQRSDLNNSFIQNASIRKIYNYHEIEATWFERGVQKKKKINKNEILTIGLNSHFFSCCFNRFYRIFQWNFLKRCIWFLVFLMSCLIIYSDTVAQKAH